MQHKDGWGARRRALVWVAMSWLMVLGMHAQGVSTTTVQGTLYLANGQPGSGTLLVKWPAFTTAAGQAITAGSTTVQVPADGFVSISLAPNQGATPAGEYYTAVYYLSDGSSNTEYWIVPSVPQATIAQVRAQVMPSAQAVQAASKAYVDQSISQLTQSLLTASGGTLSGPLYLNSDPSQPLQAADKHYVDTLFAEAVPLTGATLTGPLTATRLGASWQVDQFAGADFGARLQACVNALAPAYGGICDARNFTGSQTISANVTLSTANTTVLLPCATISTASQIVVPAGIRNVSLRGCALRGGSQASGAVGGTVFAYSGSAAMLQVGDPSYAVDTPGFHIDNAVINTTAATSAAAQALAAYRAQELDIESLYLQGNANQTAITLDGTGNYTGGTFLDNQIDGYLTAVNAIGHQAANPATTDWLNASTFVRLHIDCPTSSGSPMAGTTGINLQQGDGNTFTGGDVEGCATALHLGANAQNNTIVGLRNENSSRQIVADAGSAYNNWITGGTMFTGQLVDNGTRNSFLDTFHRSFNALNGDWYGSQQDATLTNHFRLGIGAGNERGLLNRYQTDAGYRWTMGLSDATAGEQFYQVLDELNGVYRLSIGQYNSGQSSTNNQTVLNSAGTGAVVLNGSNGSGTGGVIFGSGGAAETTVATVDKAGNAQFNGALQVGGTSQSTGTMTVRNNADAEVDYYLWPGLTASQKGSFTYKDWNGASQWYMVKDASNNWALNSAIGGLDSFKAYQSTNSGDTYIDASNPTGVVRVNYETGSGGGFKVYGGNSSTLYASFTGASSIAFPGLAAGSGHNCLQIDTSGYVTNTGSACGSGSGGSASVSSSTSGYIAYYTANGTSLGGVSSVPLNAGGTGATTATQALANLGALPTAGGTLTGPLNGTSAVWNGPVTTEGLATWCATTPCPELDTYDNPQQPGGGYTGANFAYKAFTQAASSTGYEGFSTHHVHIDADQGGAYNYNGSTGVKTDYIAELQTAAMRTVGQHWLTQGTMGCFGGGDCAPSGMELELYGGVIADGDEGAEAYRGQLDQGTYLFTGAVSGVSGNVLTISSPVNASTLGEQRSLIDTSSTYTSGSISGVSGLTFSGSNTAWTSYIPAGSKATICFDWLTSAGNPKMCFQGTVNSNTSWTMDTYYFEGTNAMTSWPFGVSTGAYHMYRGSMVTQVGLPLGSTVTVANGAAFTPGVSTVEEEISPTQNFVGARIVLNKSVGLPLNTEAGVYVVNASPTGLPITNAYSVDGNFSRAAYYFGTGSLQSVVMTQSDPTVALLYDSVVNANSVTVLRLYDQSGNTRTLAFNRATNQLSFSNGFYINLASGAVGNAGWSVSAAGAASFSSVQAPGMAIRSGSWSISAGTSTAVTFSPAFTTTPTSCAVTPTGDPTAVGAIWYSGLSTTGMTVNVHTSGTIGGTYQCDVSNAN